MSFIETPLVGSISLCDQVLLDPWTQKHSLIGLFNNIFSEKVPLVHTGACIFVELTDGRGKGIVQITLRHEEGGEVLVLHEQVVEIVDPTATGNIPLKADLPLESYGRYLIEVLADDKKVNSRSFTLQEPPEGFEDLNTTDSSYLPEQVDDDEDEDDLDEDIETN